MNFFEQRRYRKMVRHLLHEAHHARHMREDVAPEEPLRGLHDAEEELRAAWGRRDAGAMDRAAEKVVEGVTAVYPARSFPKIRENVEILAVALAVAMAFRTYFIQPFKIPTGSMQPTLYGITVEAPSERKWTDAFPLNLVSMALFGERYIEVKATVSGRVGNEYIQSEDGEARIWFVGGVPHRIRDKLALYFAPGDYLAQGQLMASGRVLIGDHIFVDKVRYNFSRPKRGDIIVFGTDHINYPGIRPHTFYIKRCAALPGEEVSIAPPYLVIDGQRVTDPYPFKRLLHDKGYIGYILAGVPAGYAAFLGAEGQARKLGPEEYLPLGDNTASSLDGRYFGPVKRESLVGPAFCVYWPFTKRWGVAR